MEEEESEDIQEELITPEYDVNDPPYTEEEEEEETEKSTRTPRRTSYKTCLKRETRTPGGKHPFYYVQKFRKEWLDIDDFKAWLEEVPSDITKVRCSWCQRELNARLNDLKRHIKTKKHIILSDQVLAGLNYVKKASPSKSSKDSLGCPKSQFMTILRDISAMEENQMSEEMPFILPEKPSYNQSAVSNEMSKLAVEQTENNKLLRALINVQKERLATEREKLETDKKGLAIQREMLDVLDSKLNVITA